MEGDVKEMHLTVTWITRGHNACLNSLRMNTATGSGRRHAPMAKVTLHTLSALFFIHIMLIGSLVNADSCPRRCECPSMEEVLCNDAGLTKLPADILGSGAGGQVATLDMTGNQLMELTVSSLVDAAGIANLKLGSNQIDNIQDGTFNIMAGLKTLDLSKNQLETVHQGTFSGADSLEHLDLSGNTLESIDGAFAEMSQLTRLDLSSNKIKKLTQFTFRDLESLRYLLLEGNLISLVERRTFQNLQKLMYLVLKNNPLGNIDNMEFSSNFLSYIDISECGLRYVPRGIPNSVRYLQLRRNNITVIHKRDLEEVPYVSILVLDENGITFLEEGTFAPMIYLQQLWLNGNKLMAMPRLLPTSLQRLLMDSNQLGVVTDLFPVGSQINTLSFMGNNISYISPYAFLRLPLLHSLDLSNNIIHSIYGDTFVNNSQLRNLQLSKNPITYFYSRCFYGMVNIRSLSLAYIEANATMHENIFDGLSKLKRIDLDSSPGLVWSIFTSQPVLDALSTVEQLSMRTVELSHLRDDFPEIFPNLAVLHISSTRWHCDTSMIWFRDWLKTTAVDVKDKDDLKCFTPRTLHDKPIIDLKDSDFVRATTVKYSSTVGTFPPVSSPTPAPYYQENNDDQSHFTPPNIPLLPTSFHEDLKNGRTHNPFDLDLYDSSGIGNNDEDYDGDELSHHEKPKDHKTTGKLLTWEEHWRLTSSTPRAVATAEKKYDPEGLGDSNFEINTLSKHATQHNDDLHTWNPSYDSSKSDDDTTGSNMVLVIIICSITGVIVLAVIILIVILAKRKQRTPKEEYKNAIKYQHRNDVLYFMPHDPSQTNIEGQNGDIIHSSSSRERMALVPGRDINHEGPLRVYKWEDF